MKAPPPAAPEKWFSIRSIDCTKSVSEARKVLEFETRIDVQGSTQSQRSEPDRDRECHPSPFGDIVGDRPDALESVRGSCGAGGCAASRREGSRVTPPCCRRGSADEEPHEAGDGRDAGGGHHGSQRHRQAADDRRRRHRGPVGEHRAALHCVRPDVVLDCHEQGGARGGRGSSTRGPVRSRRRDRTRRWPQCPIRRWRGTRKPTSRRRGASQ